jgi:hypothetical protein
MEPEAYFLIHSHSKTGATVVARAHRDRGLELFFSEEYPIADRERAGDWLEAFLLGLGWCSEYEWRFVPGQQMTTAIADQLNRVDAEEAANDGSVAKGIGEGVLQGSGQR